MRCVFFFLLLPTIAFGRPTCEEDPLYCQWLVYYGIEATLEELNNYNPIVLDSSYSPPLKPLIDEKKKLFGYISLGEVEQYRDFYPMIKEKGLILGEDPDWPGSYYVDLREEVWTRLVLDHLIPNIILEGFRGIFIDSLYSSIQLEEQDPKTYKGMTQAAAQLVRLIQAYFPNLQLMIDKAYALLPQIGDLIDFLVADSLYTEYNFETEKYEFVKKETFEKNVKLLHEAQKKFPHLQVFSLDYWYPDQPEVIRKIYAVERANGFRPYVGTLELDRIIPEPK